MKLYLYDHCPFCLRAEMVGNYKQVEHTKVYLLNDDETTCLALIGVKMTPILQFENGSAMGESLDIVQRFDELGSPTKTLRPCTDIAANLAQFNEVRQSINTLLFPRNIAIGLPEFATQSAQDYFERKKTAIINMPFSQALQQTAQHKAIVEKMLAALPSFSLPAEYGDTLSMDDVLLYPTLRNLTMVKDLQIPPALRAYLQAIAALTCTHLYFDRAI